MSTREPDAADSGFLSFAEVALRSTTARLPDTDPEAMRLVMLLHRVANAVVYDLESSVHRPAGWSWSAFRLVFTLWVSGAVESRRAAALTGMSRAAVSSLTNTLTASGHVERSPDPHDGRTVVLSLSEEGTRAIEEVFRTHNKRESEWAGLLEPDELRTLNAILSKLASAATAQQWIRRRD